MVSAEDLIRELKKERPKIKIRKTKVTGVPISILKELRIKDIRRLTKEFKSY